MTDTPAETSPAIQVQCTEWIDAPADLVWTVVGDFGSGWHPAMETCRLEMTNGAAERVFTVAGVSTVFRERMLFHSDTERMLSYRMMAGSTVLDRYDATVRVVADGDGAKVVWSAVLAGQDPDAVAESASETREIFAAGLGFLKHRIEMRSLVAELPHRIGQLSAGEGELVLFLHGIGGRKENWRQQIQALAPHAHAVALDLRGYGESDLAFGELRLEDHFADIHAVMAAYGVERAHLVGMSYGSWMAASFAHAYPDRVTSLLLSGGCTGMSEAEPETVRAFREAREAPLDRGLTPADIAPDVVRMLKGPQCPPTAEAELLASMSAIRPEAYRAAVRCFTSPPFRLDFARFVMPVLMMTGEHDRLAPPAEISGVARRIAAARAMHKSPAEVRFEVLPGAGHLCNLEAPESYNRLLTGFLSSHLSKAEAHID
ncbi:alpha/beta fold hydrolase [Rhizobium sp. KVB221]|uniref:Alpha/beta fold hydrolase n=1 Tax=Rhizobium setariae TaxID=2801340 RepID=A0A936YJJ8_9HYPH|nr:alpha/beta fold hydrolase [Rhizobium setariae]MBL0371455.1 alpha/beta fold hydrolase [Rhizobium setariae]